ncbi:hypothetical protein VDGE_30681 [Verticillium dahliae]|uniref:Protein kinase domain-containing protein n=1 Tax=Verticillium dahliae TaxID=27337 RepID=A0A444RMK1_VERDA|nr:hypothetical protein VDGE_30681 [Verticillium dahliae]
MLALAVSAVHSQGYVHGDLHLGNILLQLPSSLNTLSVELLYAQLGPRSSSLSCSSKRSKPVQQPESHHTPYRLCGWGS